MSNSASPLETGLYCYRNSERLCGPDCMAFLSDPPGTDCRNPDGTVKQWGHCMCLVETQRLTKHVVLIANIYHAEASK